MSDVKQFNIGNQIVSIKDEVARNRITALEENKNVPGGGILPLVDLGTEYTAELKQDISSGTFKKAVVGGYLTINNHKYYFAHPDYWLHTGDTECTTHHMVVVPEYPLTYGQMNSDNDITGGYMGSGLKSGTNHDNSQNTALTDAAAIIKNDFGAANILTHRELFVNATNEGYATGAAWYDSDIDLMNEPMVYGGYMFTNQVQGTDFSWYHTIDKSQLKLFAERPDLITTRSNWWLRDVAYSAIFALVGSFGGSDAYLASDSFGVRPAFAIC